MHIYVTTQSLVNAMSSYFNQGAMKKEVQVIFIGTTNGTSHDVLRQWLNYVFSAKFSPRRRMYEIPELAWILIGLEAFPWKQYSLQNPTGRVRMCLTISRDPRVS